MQSVMGGEIDWTMVAVQGVTSAMMAFHSAAQMDAAAAQMDAAMEAEVRGREAGESARLSEMLTGAEEGGISGEQSALALGFIGRSSAPRPGAEFGQLAGGVNPGKLVGAAYEILQKWSAKGQGVAKIGERLTGNEAASLAGSGGNVVMDSSYLARKVGHELAPLGGSLEHNAAGIHSPLPHYHVIDAAGNRVPGIGHIFYKPQSIFLEIMDMLGPIFIGPPGFFSEPVPIASNLR
jgi:hypothetical protein